MRRLSFPPLFLFPFLLFYLFSFPLGKGRDGEMEKMCLRAAFIGLLRFFLLHPKRWEKEERNGNEICGVMGGGRCAKYFHLASFGKRIILDILRLLTAYSRICCYPLPRSSSNIQKGETRDVGIFGESLSCVGGERGFNNSEPCVKVARRRRQKGY